MASFKKLALLALTLAVGAGLGYGVAQWRLSGQAAIPADGAHTGAAASAPGAAERKVLYWYDPMVPQHKFDKPGKSPFMDMQLVPKYADEAPSGGVSVDPRMAQALGVRTAPVERQRLGATDRKSVV